MSLDQMRDAIKAKKVDEIGENTLRKQASHKGRIFTDSLN